MKNAFYLSNVILIKPISLPFNGFPTQKFREREVQGKKINNQNTVSLIFDSPEEIIQISFNFFKISDFLRRDTSKACPDFISIMQSSPLE